MKRKRYETRSLTKRLKKCAGAWLWRQTKIKNFNDLATNDPISKERKFIHVHKNGVTVLHDCLALRQAIVSTGKKIDYYSREPLNTVEMNRLDRLCKKVRPDLGDLDEDIQQTRMKKDRKSYIDFVWNDRSRQVHHIVLQINACINDKFQKHFTSYLMNHHLLPHYRNLMHKLCSLDRNRAEKLHQEHLNVFKPENEMFDDLLSLTWFAAHVGVKGNLARRYISLDIEEEEIHHFLV